MSCLQDRWAWAHLVAEIVVLRLSRLWSPSSIGAGLTIINSGLFSWIEELVTGTRVDHTQYWLCVCGYSISASFSKSFRESNSNSIIKAIFVNKNFGGFGVPYLTSSGVSNRRVLRSRRVVACRCFPWGLRLGMLWQRPFDGPSFLV